MWFQTQVNEVLGPSGGSARSLLHTHPSRYVIIKLVVVCNTHLTTDYPHHPHDDYTSCRHSLEGIRSAGNGPKCSPLNKLR